MADTNADRLARHLTAGHPCVLMVTTDEAYATSLAIDATPTSMPMWFWTATRGVSSGMLADPRPVDGTEAPAAALYHLRQNLTGRAVCVLSDLRGHLDDPVTLRALRELIDHAERERATVVLLDHAEAWPEPIRAVAERFDVALPDDAELESILRDTLKAEHREAPVEVELTRRHLDTIIRNLAGLSRRQARRIIAELVAEDRRFDAEDLNHVLALKRRHLEGEGLLEYVEAPVDLASIGGLVHLKAWLQHRSKSVSEEAAAFGLPAPRGILLLGVQGAGKSLSAKAIATAWNRPLLRLDPTALYDRFVGESERRLRSALDQAERMAPVVLWIDEIEKGFASAAAQSNDGGLSQRMFGTLLTWMQEHVEPVFLVATANNIEALPPELLRKGRFDEVFFVDLPVAEVRAQIASIHLRNRGRDPEEFDVAALAAASDGYSGAEIEQGIIAALHTAFSADQQLTTDHIIAALAGSPPLSVTMAERIARLRAWARDRCKPAG